MPDGRVSSVLLGLLRSNLDRICTAWETFENDDVVVLSRIICCSQCPRHGRNDNICVTGAASPFRSDFPASKTGMSDGQAAPLAVAFEYYATLSCDRSTLLDRSIDLVGDLDR